uniref:J domain-containing protein n=1 Tax=Strigamia maritima TaxID=126957 RepID=T1ILY5_STRMM
MANFASTSRDRDKDVVVEGEVAFQHFYSEVKEIEERDSVLTPKQQIERLLRPGSTYFNLNPFEVSSPESECLLKTHQFSAKILNTDVYFQILQLKDSFFLWIGASPVLSELSVAMPCRNEILSSQLIGANADSASNVIATRLAKRTAKQVFVSYSLDAQDKLLLSHVEKKLAEELERNYEKFYLNLTSSCVLRVDPETPIEDVKKQYRKLSILVHPDKNQDDPDRAERAFEILNKAYKSLENELVRQRCLDIIEEAKARTEMMIQEKKKKLRKDGKPAAVEEDDPDKRKHSEYVMTMKLFADNERKRREQEQRDLQERKRKREDEIETEEKSKLATEWQKNFEESREGRVNKWKDFQKGSKSKKSKFSKTGFKPPKHKAETR